VSPLGLASEHIKKEKNKTKKKQKKKLPSTEFHQVPPLTLVAATANSSSTVAQSLAVF